MPKKFRRRQYLVATKFQLKYVGIILLFMFVIAAVSGYTVFYTAWTMLGEKLARVYPTGRLINIINTVNMTLLLRLLLITPVVVIVGIMLSHRIAGPIYRMERYMETLISGDYSRGITLREKDELKNLAEKMNQLRDRLYRESLIKSELLNNVQNSVDLLKDAVASQRADTDLLRKVQDILEQSREELKKIQGVSASS